MTIGEQLARQHQELCRKRRTEGVKDFEQQKIANIGALLDEQNGGRQPANVDHRKTSAQPGGQHLGKRG